MEKAQNGQSFGQLVLKHRFATPEQVNECVDIQSQMRAMGILPKNLGEILLEKNYISKDQAAAILRMQGQEGPQAQLPGYEIICKLGQGAMGAVFKAKQVSMDRFVAIKVLAPRFAKDTAFVTRFVREARAVAKLHHQNIISGIDVGEHAGIHFFVMEFVDGETVGGMLKKSGALPEKQALNIVLQIVRALEHANSNSMVHRDVKPDNIMLTSDGVAKLCDLGLARQEGGDAFLTQPGQALGTPHYISPEQACGEKDVDIRSDIYSLGATLYHMISGATPFSAGTASVVMAKHLVESVPPLKERKPGVSPAISAIVAKMMSRPREERYQTPAELITDLENILENQPPVHAKVEAPRMPVRKPVAAQIEGLREIQRETRKRSHKASGILVGAASLLMLAGVVFLAVRYARDENQPVVSNQPADTGKKDVKPPIHDDSEDAAATDRELDRKAKEELDAILARQSRIPGDPSQMATVEGRFEEFLTRYKGTKWEIEGLNAQQKFTLECEGMAETALAALVTKAKPLEEAGRLHEAASVFDEFPKIFSQTAAMQKALTDKSRLLDAMSNRFSTDLAAVDGHVQQKEFDKALAVLEGVKAYGSPRLVAEAQAKAKTVQTEKEAYANTVRTRAQELYAAFQREFWPLLDRKKKNYDAARRLVEESLKNPEMAFMQSELKDDMRDVELLIGFWRDVERGMDRCVESKELVKLLLFKELAGTLVRKEKKIYFETSIGGGTSSTAIDVDMLKDDDVLFFAFKVFSAEDGLARLKMGLFCFYAANLKKAKEHLLKAQEKGELRAKTYLDRIHASEMSGEENKARALFAEAKEFLKAQRFAEAQKAFQDLLARYANLPFVKENLEEIRKLLAKAESKLAAAEAHPLQKLVKGKVKKLAGDKVEVFYDFSADEQLDDWEVGEGIGGGGGGEWKRDANKAGLSGTNCSRPFCWKPLTIGDVMVEVSVTIVDDRNVGLTVCDDRRGRAYLGVMAMQIPRIGRGMMSFSPNSLLKTNLQRGWDPDVLLELGGRSTPKLVKNATYLMKIQRVGRQIVFALGNDVIANTQDPEHTRGCVSLWLLNSSAFFNSVKITCTVDPEWLKGPPEQPPR